MLQYDAAALSFQEVAVAREPGCPVCGEAPDDHGVSSTPVSA